jgi:hypothetical protein
MITGGIASLAIDWSPRLNEVRPRLTNGLDYSCSVVRQVVPGNNIYLHQTDDSIFKRKKIMLVVECSWLNFSYCNQDTNSEQRTVHAYRRLQFYPRIALYPQNARIRTRKRQRPRRDQREVRHSETKASY